MPSYLSKLGQMKWSKDRIKYLSLPRNSSPSMQDRSSLEDGPEVGLLQQEKGGMTASARAQPRPIWRNGWFMVTHIALFMVYVFILFLVALNKNGSLQSMPFSTFLQAKVAPVPGACKLIDFHTGPARDSITWHETVFTIEDHLKESPYTARPGPSVDKAWHDLLQGEFTHRAFTAGCCSRY